MMMQTMITITWWKQSQVLVSAPHGVHQDRMHIGLDNDVAYDDDAHGRLEKERGDDNEDNDDHEW